MLGSVRRHSEPLPPALSCLFANAYYDSEFGREYDCTVNAICPGPTNTHGFNHAGEKFLASLQPVLDATPKAARVAEPSEIAGAVGLLCEEKAGWVTGVCLGVNGGFHMP